MAQSTGAGVVPMSYISGPDGLIVLHSSDSAEATSRRLPIEQKAPSELKKRRRRDEKVCSSPDVQIPNDATGGSVPNSTVNTDGTKSRGTGCTLARRPNAVADGDYNCSCST